MRQDGQMNVVRPLSEIEAEIATSRSRIDAQCAALTPHQRDLLLEYRMVAEEREAFRAQAKRLGQKVHLQKPDPLILLMADDVADWIARQHEAGP